MKKLLLSITALVILGVSAASAQGFQGKWWVMGQAGYNSASGGDVSEYSILPVFGTFVAPTTTIGLGIGYLGSTDKTKPNIDKLTTGTFVVQPLARKYWPVTEKFLIFGQASVPLQFGKETAEVGNVKADGKFTSYGIEIAPGIDYFLSDHFSIEASFGLVGWNSVKPEGGDTVSAFGIGINSGFLNGAKFGIKYVF